MRSSIGSSHFLQSQQIESHRINAFAGKTQSLLQKGNTGSLSLPHLQTISVTRGSVPSTATTQTIHRNKKLKSQHAITKTPMYKMPTYANRKEAMNLKQTLQFEAAQDLIVTSSKSIQQQMQRTEPVKINLTNTKSMENIRDPIAEIEPAWEKVVHERKNIQI